LRRRRLARDTRAWFGLLSSETQIEAASGGQLNRRAFQDWLRFQLIGIAGICLLRRREDLETGGHVRRENRTGARSEGGHGDTRYRNGHRSGSRDGRDRQS